MSYYTGVGDYYSGKGDPGFGSILGGILGVGSKVASVIPGAGAVSSALSLGSKALKGTKSSRPPARQPQLPRIPASPTPGITGFVQRALPGGQTGYSCATGQCPPGEHLDKRTQTKCVTNRRMNYTNPRALSRANKRIDGFVHVARKALGPTKYKVVNESYRKNWRKPTKR